ncbi:hypothetical protein RHMOL_Rhmol05G0176900 [Rhododendron molle]|uniref:Uncharacterized protein n=1 Tax=Rhododendron molle TaxID=49168 RepID=A0ACC0NQH3_RHOML|nr:hypothetical protein RHMOL_Rhmol05G0176900 [Rhododendron molle]
MIPASIKVAMGGWVYKLPLSVENGPRVVFNPSQEQFEKVGDGIPLGITVGGERGEGGRKMTRGSNVFVARGAAKGGCPDLFQILNLVLGLGLGLGGRVVIAIEGWAGGMGLWLAIAGALRRPVQEGRTDSGRCSQTIVDDSEDLVDVGLERNSELISTIGRESEEPWNDGELLTIDRTMQLFTDIEEKWRNEVGQEVNKGGSKASKGVRELKSWNVRGLNAREKRVIVKSLFKEWKADVVCLQETKLRKVTREGMRELCGSRWVDWIHLDVIGAARGVLVLWDSRVVKRLDDEVGMFSVSCLFKNVADGFRWVFIRLYSPVINRLGEDMWEELSAVAFRWDAPWCVGGDFNVVCFPHERWGCISISRNMRRFSDLIGDLELIDPPLSGSYFTWYGAQEFSCGIPSLRAIVFRGHVSGLKVNLGKSEMILVGQVDDIGALAQLLGCKVNLLLAVYLSLPLGVSFKSNPIWDSIVERFQ